MNEEPTYVQLTPNYRVFRCDDRNFEVEEFRTVVARRGKNVTEKKRETDKWVSVGYYSDLPTVVDGVLKQSVGKSTVREKMDLESAVKELKKVSEELKTAIAESGIKVTDFVKAPDGRGRKSGTVRVAKVKNSTPVTPKQRDNKPKKRGRPKKVKS